VADEDDRAACPPDSLDQCRDVVFDIVERVLAGNKFVAFGLQGRDQLREAGAVGPKAVGEGNAGLVLRHTSTLLVVPLKAADT
jgi:hypothetical protein